MYVCVYVCMYVCTYVRTYVRTYVCMYVGMHVYMSRGKGLCLYIYIDAHIDTDLKLCVCTEIVWYCSQPTGSCTRRDGSAASVSSQLPARLCRIIQVAQQKFSARVLVESSRLSH